MNRLWKNNNHEYKKVPDYCHNKFKEIFFEYRINNKNKK